MSINNLFEKGNKFFLAQNHGFNEKGTGYANLTDTKNFLITNDIPSNKIINLFGVEYDVLFLKGINF